MTQLRHVSRFTFHVSSLYLPEAPLEVISCACLIQSSMVARPPMTSTFSARLPGSALARSLTLLIPASCRRAAYVGPTPTMSVRAFPALSVAALPPSVLPSIIVADCAEGEEFVDIGALSAGQ